MTSPLPITVPKEKVDRIIMIIYGFLACPTQTKHNLLSLLGHVNFAIRVTPQGRAIISHLLTAAHSILALEDSVSLDGQCFRDLEMWHLFLLQWNGLSMFYDDRVSPWSSAFSLMPHPQTGSAAFTTVTGSPAHGPSSSPTCPRMWLPRRRSRSTPWLSPCCPCSWTLLCYAPVEKGTTMR